MKYRELKFRAWIDEYKQYLYFGGDFKEQNGRWGKGRCTLAGNAHIAELHTNEDNSNMFYQVHKVKCIEQYTGLKDKNGKEIYEGDIIQENLSFDNEAVDGIFKYKVYWNENELCWSLEYIGNDSIHDDLWECNSSVEVIGNIHDNPELLEAN